MLLRDHPHTFNGLKIRTSFLMVETIEDWSLVRSPSRAKRRLKRGFPQRIFFVKVPSEKILCLDGTYIMHPQTYEKLMLVAEANSPTLLQSWV